MDDLLASVSHVVSRAARHVGFALADSHAAVLQRIEFVPLGGSRVLVIVVARGNQVTQKVVDAREMLAVRRSGAGRQLPEHRVRRPAAARRTRGGASPGCSRSARSTISCWRARFAWRSSTLEELPATADVPRRRRGVAARRHCTRAGVAGHAAGAARHDGRERADGAAAQRLHRRPRPDRRDWHRARRARSAAFSLIACTAVDGTTTRTVGVIGPTRMRYSRAITLVDGTTQAVSRVLRDAP